MCMSTHVPTRCPHQRPPACHPTCLATCRAHALGHYLCRGVGHARCEQSGQREKASPAGSGAQRRRRPARGASWEIRVGIADAHAIGIATAHTTGFTHAAIAWPTPVHICRIYLQVEQSRVSPKKKWLLISTVAAPCWGPGSADGHRHRRRLVGPSRAWACRVPFQACRGEGLPNVVQSSVGLR